MVPGKLDIHMQNDEVGPLPHIVSKNKLKTDQDLNVRSKTMNLEENTGKKLPDIGFGNDYFSSVT